MPNWCYVNISFFFRSEEEAENFRTMLEAEGDLAEKENRGLDLGMKDNWLFDIQYKPERLEQRVYIQGEIRWGYSPEQIQGLCAWGFRHGAVEVTSDYMEDGNCILGEWIADWDSGKIVDRYLPDDHPAWELYNSEDGEASVLDLEEEDHSVREWPFTFKEVVNQ